MSRRKLFGRSRKSSRAGRGAPSGFGSSSFGQSEFPSGFGSSMLGAARKAAPSRSARRSPQRPPWRSALAGACIGLLVTLVWQAPARWLAAAAHAASDGAVQLAEPHGTIWRGSARLMLAGGQGSRGRVALPGRVQWRISPGWLAAHIRLHADCCTPQGPLAARARWQWGGAQITLQDGQSAWPAAVLTGLGTLWNTVQLQGEITLQTQNLAFGWVQGRARMQGQAEITARQVASRLSPLKPLGSYRVTLTGGEAPTLRLATLPGSALLLSGTGQWAGQRLRFTGQAEATPGTEAQLLNLLNILGRRQDNKAEITFG